ncbi:MAG: penicillin-binding protein, partial [Geobacter sp.]
ASGGYRTTPHFVTKVIDGDGNVLEEIIPPSIPAFARVSSAGKMGEVNDVKAAEVGSPLSPIQVISPETSYIMTNLMESVVASGTGQRARALGRPVAGKTGTTNDMKDAWFIGYVPQLVAGVWVGYDQEKSLGAGGSGGQAAAPIWTDFMQRSLARVPAQSFVAPPNVTFALINRSNGRLAREGSEGSVMECFISGTEPTSYDAEYSIPVTGDFR